MQQQVYQRIEKSDFTSGNFYKGIYAIYFLYELKKKRTEKLYNQK